MDEETEAPLDALEATDEAEDEPQLGDAASSSSRIASVASAGSGA